MEPRLRDPAYMTIPAMGVRPHNQGPSFCCQLLMYFYAKAKTFCLKDIKVEEPES